MVAPLTKDVIIRTLKVHKAQLSSMGVRRLGLFGSYLRNEQNSSSDIDFIVLFDKASFDKYMDLKFFLEDTFKRKVDLVMEEALIPSIQYVKEEAIYA